MFVYDDDLNYKLSSNMIVPAKENKLYSGVEIKTNSLGLRNLEIDINKKHLLVLGDSVSFGYGVKAEETFSNLLQVALGNDWQVINSGVPGYNVGQYEQMWMRLKDIVEPELVVIMLNSNDAEPRYELFQAGMTLSRTSFYPWEKQWDPNIHRIDKNAWILPRISQFKALVLSRDRRFPSTKKCKNNT